MRTKTLEDAIDEAYGPDAADEELAKQGKRKARFDPDAAYEAGEATYEAGAERVTLSDGTTVLAVPA